MSKVTIFGYKQKFDYFFIYIVCTLKFLKKIIYDYTAFELGIIKIIKLKWCIKIL